MRTVRCYTEPSANKNNEKKRGKIIMARRRKSSTDDIVKAILAFLLLGYGALANFWKNLTPADRTLFIGLSIIALVAAITFIVVLIRYKNQQRRIVWEKAMIALSGSKSSLRVPEPNSVKGLSPIGLEKFAVQTYRKMGYKVVHTGHSGDHGIDAHLTNPNGQVELVQCKQWNHPVGEPEVRDLLGAMAGEKAVRGIIWAPGGFSEPARRWAKGKPIILADDREINRIVESVYSE